MHIRRNCAHTMLPTKSVLSLACSALVFGACAGAAHAQEPVQQLSQGTPYGQPAGNALDRPFQPYGQPAGNALDRPLQPYGQPAGNNLDRPLQPYGQPAGNALDRPVQPYGQPAGNALDVPVQPQPGTTGGLTQPPIGVPPNVPNPSAPPTVAPEVANPIDFTNSVLGRLELEMDGAQFMSAAVDKLHVIVDSLDMRNGTLKGLNLAMKGGQFLDLTFDQLMIATQGDLQFDRNELLANRTLHFMNPAQAQVSAIVSQDSLNRFLNMPTTLNRLSATAASKVHFLTSLLGSNANIGVSLSDASVLLEKGNRVNVGVKARLGMGNVGVPLPLALDTKLGLNEDGWISLADTKLISNGQEISPMLSNMLVKRFNEMTDWGKKSDDIKFSFSELKVIPNKQFIVKGTAMVTRLRFGHPTTM